MLITGVLTANVVGTITELPMVGVLPNGVLPTNVEELIGVALAIEGEAVELLAPELLVELPTVGEMWAGVLRAVPDAAVVGVAARLAAVADAVPAVPAVVVATVLVEVMAMVAPGVPPVLVGVCFGATVGSTRGGCVGAAGVGVGAGLIFAASLAFASQSVYSLVFLVARVVASRGLFGSRSRTLMIW